MNEVQNNEKNNNTLKIVIIVLLVIIIVMLGFILGGKLFGTKESTGNEGDNATNVVENNKEDELDINSSLVKNLAKPFNVYDNSIGITEPQFIYELFKQDKYKMYLAMAQIKKNCAQEGVEFCEESEFVKIDNQEFNIFIEADELEKEYRKIFGPDSNYKNKTLSNKLEYCGLPYYYETKTKKYWGVNACGGDNPEAAHFELYKALQKNNEIDLYYHSYTYNSETNVKSEVKTYKLIFTKQSDGNYYINNGEWE